jgi:hypothetical protein
MTLTPAPPDNLEQQSAAISSRHRNSLQFAAYQNSRCNLQLTRKLAAICKFFLNLRLLEAHPHPKIAYGAGRRVAYGHPTQDC